MKNFILTVALTTAVVMTTGAINPPKKGKVDAITTSKIDVATSKATWEAKKVTGKHNGEIALQSGTLKLQGNKIVGGEMVIDMNNITCSDLKDDTWNKKFIGHLKSEDFFNSAVHGTSTFKIVRVEMLSKAEKGNNAKVTGNLTIKGITRSISFPANVTMANGQVKASGEAEIDRTLFDIKYGSGKFFPDLGDKMIDDTFKVGFNVTASK